MIRKIISIFQIKQFFKKQSTIFTFFNKPIGKCSLPLFNSLPSLNTHSLAKFHFNMSNSQCTANKHDKLSIHEPPECVIGMTTLDRSKFNKKVSIPIVKLDTKELNTVVRLLKPYLLKIPNFKPVQHKENDVIIYLNYESFKDENTKIEDAIQNLLNTQTYKFEWKEIELNYESFNASEILQKVLQNEEPVSSFSIIGHLLHLNLKPRLDPFKQLIGEVLLDKNPPIKLVVNKLDKIDSKFRFFEMETLAKRDKDVTSVVQVRESGCTFRFDFAKVYWNPRLGTEHERIVKLVNAGKDIVYDVFAGVGPFSVPIAVKKKCKVIANDLNPASFQYLQENAVLNKAKLLTAYNLDGGEFIKTMLKKDLLQEWTERQDKFEMQDAQFHVLMNLPALAIEFLTHWVGLFNSEYEENESFRSLWNNGKFQLPYVHCYTFYKGTDDGKEWVLNTAKKNLQCDDLEPKDIFFVRTVAPNKIMYRLSLRLPKRVLVSIPTVKKQRTQ